MEKYPVSKTKLYSELNRRGLTPAAASKELGFADGYIANCAGNGEISARGALYLEHMFNITPDDYRPDLLDEIEACKAADPERIPNEAVQTIAETFARVLVEQYRETYRQTITDAILQALRERDA